LLPLNPARDTILRITTTSGKTVNIPPNKALAVSRHAWSQVFIDAVDAPGGEIQKKLAATVWID